MDTLFFQSLNTTATYILPLSKNLFGMSIYLDRMYSQAFLPRLSKLDFELNPRSRWSFSKK